jgi:hypothetical protein
VFTERGSLMFPLPNRDQAFLILFSSQEKRLAATKDHRYPWIVLEGNGIWAPPGGVSATQVEFALTRDSLVNVVNFWMPRGASSILPVDGLLTMVVSETLLEHESGKTPVPLLMGSQGMCWMPVLNQKTRLAHFQILTSDTSESGPRLIARGAMMAMPF